MQTASNSGSELSIFCRTSCSQMLIIIKMKCPFESLLPLLLLAVARCTGKAYVVAYSY